MRHALIALSFTTGLAAADQPITELRLGIDGGIAHEDKLDVVRDNGATSGGGVEARPVRLIATLAQAPWGIGTRGGFVVAGDAFYGRSRGGAKGEQAAGVGAVTTVETRVIGIGLDAGYALPIARRWTAEALLSESYLSESIRAEEHVANDTRTAEDDFGAVGWESAVKLAARYAVSPAWDIAVTGRIIVWNRASARFQNEDVRYRQRGAQLGVDMGYRF